MGSVSVIGSAVFTCLLGGIVPWISVEVVVIAASLALPRGAGPVLVLACTLAQMGAKIAIYALARWSPGHLPRRATRLLEAAGRYRDGRSPWVLVLSGSLLGVPPFYLITLACGLTRVRFASFALSGFVGTAARYAILVWFARAFVTS